MNCNICCSSKNLVSYVVNGKTKSLYECLRCRLIVSNQIDTPHWPQCFHCQSSTILDHATKKDIVFKCITCDKRSMLSTKQSHEKWRYNNIMIETYNFRPYVITTEEDCCTCCNGPMTTKSYASGTILDSCIACNKKIKDEWGNDWPECPNCTMYKVFGPTLIITNIEGTSPALLTFTCVWCGRESISTSIKTLSK